ncbi:hypothetical protein AB205_0104180 [Aquarana catesbeiana]|uniref:Uncharacterized protein n=1 Tax=Aquarana catesbeiana TaxID=8400 RepID=A0A2G9R743_AQUCT|nr:hypothetical protein AB205_0104180 [Aquarana catesbeiana]
MPFPGSSSHLKPWRRRRSCKWSRTCSTVCSYWRRWGFVLYQEVIYDESTQAECGTFRYIGGKQQEMVNLYPQTLVAETGDLIDFSAEEEQPGEPPAKELVLGPNFTELCQAPTAVSVELQGTSPAEALVTGQRVQDLCPTPSAVPEAQGEKVAITSQQQIQGEKGEEVFVVPPQQSARVEKAVFPPQQRSMHLGDSTIGMSSQQQDEGMEKEAASSPPQWQLHSLGVEESSLLPQTVNQTGGCEVHSRSAGKRAECYQPLPSTGNNCGDPGRRGSRPLSPATS